MIKKSILVILLSVLYFSTNAQELPFTKHYIFDQTILNPALGAKYDYFSVKLTGTDQWVSLPDHPQTQTLTFNMKFKNSMGFNAAILNELYGAVQNTGIKLSYFYYTRLNKQGDYISYGLSASLMQNRFGLPTDGSYVGDPTLNQGILSVLYPNVSAGVYYNMDDISLGFSATNLIPYKPQVLNTTYEPNRTRTYFLYGETKFANEINTFAVIPSVMFMIDEKLQREIDLNGKMVFQSKYWVGISYKDALSFNSYAIHNFMAMVGFKFFKKLNISYGYDFGVLAVRSVYGGTHYFMIGYDFINPRGKYPMYF